MSRKTLHLFISFSIPLAVLFIPASMIPIEGLTLIEQRVMAIFVMATLLWILEPIPIFSTSVLIILLELVVLSNKSFILFQNTSAAADFGRVIPYEQIMATFASPIILLFLGGFFLAMAATKYRLDVNLARVLLRPFGVRPKWVLLGLMTITAVFSMFMSNTATTAMMLALLTPILAAFDANDGGKNAFVLGIPFAANVGGIGTPIGTPPNAVALKYLSGENAIGFGSWMTFAVPFVIVLLFFTWFLLLHFFPPSAPELRMEIKGSFLKNRKALVVYGTFILTILLWLTDAFHGMNSYIVALIPVAVFTTTGIITTADMKRISWDVLWLVSGGIALGMALEESGLAANLIRSIPFEAFPALSIVFITTLIAIVMATFMSNTATANLLLPIVAALGVSLGGLEPLGGSKMILLGVTFACSLAMSLVISTPPNAMAQATGLIESRSMMKSGIIIGVVGLCEVYAMLYILKQVGFL
ncbi:MAG: SLC13 family permease [Calditrichia bacterium]